MITFKQNLYGAAAILLVLVSGCAKKEDTPAPVEKQSDSASAPQETTRPEPSAAATSPATAQAAFDQIVELWKNGQNEPARRVFLATDWTRPGVFADGPVFGLSEAQFGKLPQSQRTKVAQQAVETAKDIREVAKFMVEQAKQNPSDIETYRTALTAFAQRLTAADQLELIQIVGKAVTAFTEKELGAGN